MTRYCATCGAVAEKKSDNLYQCALGHDNWVNPVPGATVFVVKDGRVLYGIRSIEPGKGKLEVPGGFIEISETAEQAAVRETKEELGIDVTLRACLGTYLSTYDGRPILNIVFVAGMADQPVTPGDDMSGGEPTWHDINNLPTADELAWGWYAAAQTDLQNWWHNESNRPS